MDAIFQFTDNTPIAALSVGQFRELLAKLVQPQQIAQPKQEDYPEIFGKSDCCKFTGYKENTINKMICERQIPYYKSRSKVYFKREEIREWMLLKRVSTVAEYVDNKESELAERRAKR